MLLTLQRNLLQNLPPPHLLRPPHTPPPQEPDGLTFKIKHPPWLTSSLFRLTEDWRAETEQTCEVTPSDSDYRWLQVNLVYWWTAESAAVTLLRAPPSRTSTNKRNSGAPGPSPLFKPHLQQQRRNLYVCVGGVRPPTWTCADTECGCGLGELWVITGRVASCRLTSQTFCLRVFFNLIIICWFYFLDLISFIIKKSFKKVKKFSFK